MTFDDCCAEERRKATVARRTLLKGLGVFAAGGVVSTLQGSVFTQTAFAARGTSNNVLLVLSMRGGADGLSLVVPYGDANYSTARSRIAVPTSTLLAPDGMFGLHPDFAPLLPMWSAGQMAAVQAVGLPQPNRSHFAAIQEVEEADPGSSERVGWLNRVIGVTDPGTMASAVQIGSTVADVEVSGPEASVSTVDVSKIELVGPPLAMRQRRRALDVMWGDEQGVAGPGARNATVLDGVWAPVLATPAAPQNGAVYPAGDLGDALAEAVRVIRADVGAEIITVDFGSWDMHTDLGTYADGQMHDMLSELANALAAFFTDLGAESASKVTAVTISEFGRRVAENGDYGLDHGYGNAMLLLGGGVRGGKVYAQWPGLADADLVNGDLKVTYDYRSVLSEVVGSRFPNADLAAVFPNFVAEQIGTMYSG